jgi:hypothetical protein
MISSSLAALPPPLLRYMKNQATPNIPPSLTPPVNPNVNEGFNPATLEQARAAMPQTANKPNPATLPRPTILPDRAPDMPVPAIKAPQMPGPLSPEMTETRRIGAPLPLKQQSLPLAKLSSLPQPLPLEAPKDEAGQPWTAARPGVPDQLDIPETRSKWWDTLKGIGYGAMIGARNSGGNPWGMLGGAAAGGIGTFKAPSNADALQYEAITKPREQADALEQYQRDKIENELALGRERASAETARGENYKVRAETEKQREARLAKEAAEKLTMDRERLEYDKGKPLAIGTHGLYLPTDGRIVEGTPRPQAPQALRENVPAYKDPVTGEIIPNEYYIPYDERGQARDDRVSPAEERLRTKEVTTEIARHNKLRADLIYKGDQLQRMSKEDSKYAAAVDDYNALKQQFDDESERLRSTYDDALEDHGTPGWPFFKPAPRPDVKPRQPQPAAPRRKPVANADAEMLDAVRKNPQLYIEQMRRDRMTQAQIDTALKAAGVK